MQGGDGHAEYWKLKDPRTIAGGQAFKEWLLRRESYAFAPTYTGGLTNPDSLRVNQAVWGLAPRQQMRL